MNIDGDPASYAPAALPGCPCAAKEYPVPANEDLTKPVILLVHGNSSTPNDWETHAKDPSKTPMIAETLLADGYHVYAADFRYDLVDDPRDPNTGNPAKNFDHGWATPILQSLISALIHKYPTRQLTCSRCFSRVPRAPRAAPTLRRRRELGIARRPLRLRPLRVPRSPLLLRLLPSSPPEARRRTPSMRSMLQTPVGTIRYRAIGVGGGLDVNYRRRFGNYDGVGAQFVQDQSQVGSGPVFTTRYLNIGTTYWLARSIAMGLRFSQWTLDQPQQGVGTGGAPASAQTATVGERSIIATLRVVL